MENRDIFKLVIATEKDCDLLFQWINDKNVRLNSFKTELIKYKEHKRWFQKKIQSEDTKIYILKVNSKNVGVIRLEKIEDDSYLINYSIAKEYRKRGYGTELLRLIKQKYNDDLLIGKVKKKNIFSIKAFIKAGYVMKSERDIYIFYSYNQKQI